MIIIPLYNFAGFTGSHPSILQIGNPRRRSTIGQEGAKILGSGAPGVNGRWQWGCLHCHESHGFGLPTRPPTPASVRLQNGAQYSVRGSRVAHRGRERAEGWISSTSVLWQVICWSATGQPNLLEAHSASTGWLQSLESSCALQRIIKDLPEQVAQRGRNEMKVTVW